MKMSKVGVLIPVLEPFARSAYSWVMAVVWTGRDYGVLRCHLDPTYMDCDMTCGGGIAQSAGTVLETLLQESQGMKSFTAFMAEFDDATQEMLSKAQWTDHWSWDDEDASDEQLEAVFNASEVPGLGEWCFGVQPTD